jgi:hypothetical protein
VAHITRNQLEHKVAQMMTLRQKGTFSVLYTTAACAFCERFVSLLSAAVKHVDSDSTVASVDRLRVFQLDCAQNDCHHRWDAETSSLVGRVERYPTLVTYNGDTATSLTYTGDMHAATIARFLATEAN